MEVARMNDNIGIYTYEDLVHEEKDLKPIFVRQTNRVYSGIPIDFDRIYKCPICNQELSGNLLINFSNRCACGTYLDVSEIEQYSRLFRE